MTPIQIIEVICNSLFHFEKVNTFIQMAEESLDRCFFGKMFNYAVAYKACHLYTVYGGDGGIESTIANITNGAVKTMSEGDLSLGFSVGESSKNNELNSTKYGRMLLDLMNSRIKADVNRAPLVGGCYVL